MTSKVIPQIEQTEPRITIDIDGVTVLNNIELGDNEVIDKVHDFNLVNLSFVARKQIKRKKFKELVLGKIVTLEFEDRTYSGVITNIEYTVGRNIPYNKGIADLSANPYFRRAITESPDVYLNDDGTVTVYDISFDFVGTET